MTEKDLDDLVRTTYDLIDYARSKRDSAPIPSYMGDHFGHVDDDQSFCERHSKLKQEIELYLEQNFGKLEYQRFLSKLEHITPTVPADSSPVWNGMTRCRCWWDAKDELQGIADLLDSYSNMHSAEQPIRSGGADVSAQRDVSVNGDVVGRDKLVNIVINVFQSHDPRIVSVVENFTQNQITILLAIFEKGKGNTATGAVDIEILAQEFNWPVAEMRQSCRYLEDEGLIKHFEDTGRLYVITHSGVKTVKLLSASSQPRTDA